MHYGEVAVGKYEFSILKRKMPLSISNSIGFALCPLLKGTLGISIANVFKFIFFILWTRFFHICSLLITYPTLCKYSPRCHPTCPSSQWQPPHSTNDTTTFTISIMTIAITISIMTITSLTSSTIRVGRGRLFTWIFFGNLPYVVS